MLFRSTAYLGQEEKGVAEEAEQHDQDQQHHGLFQKLVKIVGADIGPQRAEADVQDIDGPGDLPVADDDLAQGQSHELGRGQWPAELLEGDQPAGQARPGVGVDVATVEGVALPGCRPGRGRPRRSRAPTKIGRASCRERV